MFLWEREQFDWVAFGWLLCLLMVHPLMNGYPFIFPDSWGYAGGICPDGIRSPVLGCAMRPISVLLGTWGYVMVQSAITAFSLVFLSSVVLSRKNDWALYLSSIIAGVGLFAGLIMADIWTLTGMVSLFSIAMGIGYPLMTMLLALSIATHYGNFPVLAGTAVLFLPFAVGRTRYAFMTLVALILAVILIVGANLFSGEIRFKSKMAGFGSLASRILYDIPQVIEKKCADDPEFRFCQIKEDIIEYSRLGSQQSMTWKGRKKLKLGWEEYNDLSREIVFYSFKEFFWENLIALPVNTFRLLSCYRLSDAIILVPTDKWEVEGIKQFFPDELDNFNRSWQASGKAHKGCRKAEFFLHWIFAASMAICLVYTGVRWGDIFEDRIARLSFFGIIAVLINAFFMSNLSGVAGRYHSRIGFLIIYPACCIVFQLTINVLKYFKFRQPKR